MYLDNIINIEPITASTVPITISSGLGIDVDLPFLQDSAERERAVEATEKLLKLFVSPEIKATLRGRDIKTVGDAIDIIAENL